MLTTLKLLATYWKDIAMGIVIAFLFYVVFAWWSSNAEISRLNAQLNLYADKNEQLVGQIATFEKAVEVLKQNQLTASKEREQIINVLSKEINKIRNQPIPKECLKAVQYGIQYKDDLTWSGQE